MMDNVTDIRVSKTVSGAKRRKPPSYYRSSNRTIKVIKVRPEVMDVVRKIQKPSQEMIIESATVVLLINRENEK